MTIQINTAKLADCAARLDALAGEAQNAKTAMSASTGLARDAEYAFATELASLATGDLPRLCTASAALLRAIVQDFERADAQNY